jgi:hypothetical protein
MQGGDTTPGVKDKVVKKQVDAAVDMDANTADIYHC